MSVFRLARPLLGIAVWGSLLFSALAPFVGPRLFCYAILIIACCGAAAMLDVSWHVLLGVRKVRDFSVLERSLAGVGSAPGSTLHVIFVPTCGEDIRLLDESLRTLAGHAEAQFRYIIVLAMESVDRGYERKVDELSARFEGKFYRIISTVHRLMPGEAAGKSANLRHSAQQVAGILVDTHRLSVDRLLVTVMDCDTLVPESYLRTVRMRHDLHSPDTPALYIVPISFPADSTEVIVLVRLVDKIWAAGVLAAMVAPAAVRFPCSVYSMSMRLVRDIGYWNAGPEAISEDMHMALKCFFGTSGKLRIEPILTPVRCGHVAGTGFLGQLHERYRQAVRHLFGGIDLAYAIDRCFAAREIGVARRAGVVLTVAAAHLFPVLGIWCLGNLPVALFVASRTSAGWLEIALAVAGVVTVATLLLLIAAAEWFSCPRGGERTLNRFAANVFWLLPALVLYALAGITAYSRLMFTDRLVTAASQK